MHGPRDVVADGQMIEHVPGEQAHVVVAQERFEIPGADFAAYRWGDTIDPIEPGHREAGAPGKPERIAAVVREPSPASTDSRIR